MGKRNVTHVADASPDITQDRLEVLKELVPEAFTEGRIDFDKLRAALGDVVDERPDRYAFSWAGKADAIRILQTPTRATLRPCPEESIDWDTTSNLFIEGDNLEVLKLLYKSYFGRVKMIYIDPPYNTGHDFIYPDNYADPLDTYLRLTGQKDSEGNLLTTNPETSGRYHSAWLSMMYPRLFFARQLLRDDGVIFISIDDNEVHDLRVMMNEVFGEENHVATIVWQKSYGGGAKVKHVVGLHEYVACYARSKETLGFVDLPADPETRKYYKYTDNKSPTRGPYRLQPLATTSMDDRENLQYTIHWQGHEIRPEKQWQWSKVRVEQALQNDELVITRSGDGWSVNYKQYLRDEEGQERGAKPFSVVKGPYTQRGTAEMRELFDGQDVFDFPKPSKLIAGLVNYAHGDPQAIVLDFFAGSCPTAQAVLALNRGDGGTRRFIMVQLPEPTGRQDFSTIAEIGKERIRRVIAKLRADREGKIDFEEADHEDLGFRVFRLDHSNYAHWVPDQPRTAGEYKRKLDLFTHSLPANFDPLDVIWEVAVKEAGFGLSARIEQATIDQVTVWRVTDPEREQTFRICLDHPLTLTQARKLDLPKDELFVCLDTAITDEVAANLALQCRLRTI